MWAGFFKRWVDLCFWWLPKTKGDGEGASDTDRSHATAKSESTDLKAVERKANEDPRDADDLTVIKGIGSATQKKLSTFGITTLADLAASDPETLIAKLNATEPISAGRVNRWIKAAQARTDRRP